MSHDGGSQSDPVPWNEEEIRLFPKENLKTPTTPGTYGSTTQQPPRKRITARERSRGIHTGPRTSETVPKIPYQQPAGSQNIDHVVQVYAVNSRRWKWIIVVVLLTLFSSAVIGTFLWVFYRKQGGEVSGIKSLADACSLGMKSGRILDAWITSSSNLHDSTAAALARLDKKPNPGISNGSWCPSPNDDNKWIKIDLQRIRGIVGIVTQGSPSSESWTTSFRISCGDNEANFRNINEFGSAKAQIFEGNSDQNGKAVNFFAEMTSCRYVQIYPEKWNGNACLRLELLHGAACYFAKKHRFYAESSGAFNENECKVVINGVDHASKSRGHCVVIFDPVTGKINNKTFDTSKGSTEQPDEMLEFINNAPDYSIISIAVQESGANLSSNAITLLQQLGAVGNGCQVNITENDSWAFITQKIQQGDPRPSWVTCQQVPKKNGQAAVHATVFTSAHYSSLNDSAIG